MLVFAAETSCDETSICLMDNNFIVEHITFSQEIHKIHGGVVPELASRSHLEKIQIMTNELFSRKNIDPNEIELLGQSVDDAIGEAFDKTAKLIGLSYPGGAEIEREAVRGNENRFILPKPLVKEKNFNFSFSGIKTHINLLTKKNKIDKRFMQDLSASFQKNISDLLIEKLERGLERLKLHKGNVKSLSVVGGVSNNKYIKKNLENFFINKNIEIYYPLKEMMIDNAAMIAWACMKFYKKDRNDLFFKPMPRLEVRSVL